MSTINIIKRYNFNFLFWNVTLEKFNKNVVIPSSLDLKYKSNLTCFHIGKWLLTAVNK
jgi:hypothetical protein